MDTASVLATAGRRDFVVAPVRTAEGDTVRRLGAEHAISVFPFVDGAPGCFDQVLTGPERGLVVDMLAALHSATPPAVTPVARPELATRVRLRWALDDVALYVDSFRSPHSRTPDAELSWASLTGTVAQLTG